MDIGHAVLGIETHSSLFAPLLCQSAATLTYVYQVAIVKKVRGELRWREWPLSRFTAWASLLY